MKAFSSLVAVSVFCMRKFVTFLVLSSLVWRDWRRTSSWPTLPTYLPAVVMLRNDLGFLVLVLGDITWGLSALSNSMIAWHNSPCSLGQPMCSSISEWTCKLSCRCSNTESFRTAWATWRALQHSCNRCTSSAIRTLVFVQVGWSVCTTTGWMLWPARSMDIKITIIVYLMDSQSLKSIEMKSDNTHYSY